ncbi:MAG: carnitine 3-dehydrogenase [Gammaproteobacteria bacterium]
MSRTAAIIGGGVIGGGWAARFLLNGWDVRVFDPDPEAERKIGEVLANARRSLPGLYDAALPAEGSLRFFPTVEEAVRGAHWIQESVPERLDIKHRVLRQIQSAADPDAPIGSSTSGYKPSELAEGALRPGQVFVAHPFNPVYLLPVIEVVPHAGSEGAFIDRAMEILRSVGLKPLRVRKEIDAHIADRFLEAVWREALWLVKDDVATTEEIDDAIRFGFGIRWAQMGLFETYRVAGGEAGMAHFIAQFGPCLKWPWTKLMDVPELTDDLVHKISSQSDAQSGMHTIRELERIRDDNLVAMMRALKGRDWASGHLLREHDTRLRSTLAEPDWSQPVETLSRIVPVDWTDYNGHMNEARYLEASSAATDRFMELVGCDAAYIAAGGSYFTVETHIRHLAEVHAGARIRATTQLFDGSGKRLHLLNSLYDGAGQLLATAEHLLLHVSLETRRASVPGPALQQKLADIQTKHAALPRPGRTHCGIRD